MLDKYPPGVYYIYTPQGYIFLGDFFMKTSCCQHKSTARPEAERKKLIHRLNRIEGQIRGLRSMVESDAYCTDILTQSAAVSAAINGFNKALTASHIRGCVARDIREGNDEVIEELLQALQKLMK